MSIIRGPGCRGLALLITSSVVIGCGEGDPDAIPAVPAAGTVNYQGKPVETGYVQFVPEKGRPASGTIQNGQFTLMTYEEGDGAIPGKHQVGITATKQVTIKGRGEPVDVYIIPQRYANPSSSGVTVEVPAEGKKDIKIEIAP